MAVDKIPQDIDGNKHVRNILKRKCRGEYNNFIEWLARHLKRAKYSLCVKDFLENCLLPSSEADDEKSFKLIFSEYFESFLKRRSFKFCRNGKKQLKNMQMILTRIRQFLSLLASKSPKSNINNLIVKQQVKIS